jgi:hypothetical protein
VRRLSFLVFPAFLPGLLACNQQANGTVQIITGEETDTFTQSPVPTKIEVLAVDGDDGGLTPLGSADYPTDTIDLGAQDQSAVATLEVEALDSNGNELIYGASVPVQYGALDGETLPIFVQRVGQNARLPDPPTDARQSPVLGVLSGRFLVVAGGADPSLSSTTQVYDFGAFSLLGSPPTLPIAPTAMPIVDTVALLINADGGEYYDFSQDAGESVTPPAGYGFADVDGGQVIYDQSGQYIFVVGATRTTGSPTAAVLQIDTTDTSNANYVTGNMTWITLSAPRLGASAAWVPARGLVVAGGNATAGGVELVAPSQTAGTQLPYPPDPSVGAGMTSLDQQQYVLVAGGILADGTDAGVREIDLACGQNCAPVAWGGALPYPLTSCAAFTFDAADAFLVGSETATGATPGLTHTFTLNSAGATEVPTKVPHMNASAIVSPMQSSILVYGGADEIESFTPAPP